MPIVNIEDHEEEVPATVANTRVATAMRESDDMDLREMLSSFGSEQDFEFRIYRKAPKSFEGISIEGHLGTFEEFVSEDDLKAMYGGGTYQVKVFRPNGKGQLQYFKAKSVKIPGPPDMSKYKPKEEAAAPMQMDFGPSEDSVLAQQAMSTMKELIDQRSSHNGMDLGMLQVLMAPLQAQLQASQAAMADVQKAMAEKDARILELITKEPDTSKKDDLVSKMFDTEAQRTNSLRDVHASEMRQLRESHKDDTKRMHDRHDAELRSRDESHRREIDNIKMSMQAQIDSNRVAYEARIDGLKSEISRLERDLTESRSELGTLRTKKEKSVIEQVKEINDLKTMFNTLTGGEDKEDTRKWYEKLIDSVGENPEMIGGIVGAVTGQQPSAPMAMPEPEPQAQLPAPPAAPEQSALAEGVSGDVDPNQPMTLDQIPVGQPFRDETGATFVKLPDGQVVPYEQAIQQAREAQQEAEQKPKATPPSPMQVKLAVTFMESAFNNGTEPKAFAETAKSSVPRDILRYIEEVGVDEFLNSTAKLEAGSPLRTKGGRDFVKSVAKFLLEGVTE